VEEEGRKEKEEVRVRDSLSDIDPVAEWWYERRGGRIAGTSQEMPEKLRASAWPCHAAAAVACLPSCQACAPRVVACTS